MLIIVGTCLEIIRLAAVINKYSKYFECIGAHTGQKYEHKTYNHLQTDQTPCQTVHHNQRMQLRHYLYLMAL